MKWRTYLLLCVVLSVVVSGSILVMPGLSDTLEGLLLGFLSSNAA